MWDTSEYIAAAYTWGCRTRRAIRSSCCIGRVFTILPIAPNVAMRMNLLAALSSAVSAGCGSSSPSACSWAGSPQRWQRIVGGARGAHRRHRVHRVEQSVVNEKVYTVSLLGVAAICAGSPCAGATSPMARAPTLLILVAYLLGLGYANHMAGMLAAPAVGIAVLVRKAAHAAALEADPGVPWAAARSASRRSPRSPFAPRTSRPSTKANPPACTTEIREACTFSAKGTYDRFMYNFNRGQYGKPDR
jgi:hypothetical protein